jgi:hypothetical protein
MKFGNKIPNFILSRFFHSPANGPEPGGWGKHPTSAMLQKPDGVGANLHYATVITAFPGPKDWVPAEFTCLLAKRKLRVINLNPVRTGS